MKLEKFNYEPFSKFLNMANRYSNTCFSSCQSGETSEHITVLYPNNKNTILLIYFNNSLIQLDLNEPNADELVTSV